jgi:hypothetical protein
MIDEDDIVIKYNRIYTPNPEICPDMQFTSFNTMMNVVGVKLEAARDAAYAIGARFTMYTTQLILLPEFEHELAS